MELNEKELRFVSDSKPSKEQVSDLLFAWKVARHVKSNAIVLTKEKATVGIGAGQMSRVDAVGIAIKKADGREKNAVLASDAFFPFSDSIKLATKSKIKAIIQPGGSIKDKEVIEAADNAGIAMVFTGKRAFKH